MKFVKRGGTLDIPHALPSIFTFGFSISHPPSELTVPSQLGKGTMECYLPENEEAFKYVAYFQQILFDGSTELFGNRFLEIYTAKTDDSGRFVGNTSYAMFDVVYISSRLGAFDVKNWVESRIEHWKGVRLSFAFEKIEVRKH